MIDDNDIFDGLIEADIDRVAPGMIDAIRESLAARFAVNDVTVRTVVASTGEIATVRWAAECSDTIQEDRQSTRRDVVVHGLSLVGGQDDERVVAHYIDWAGVMSQLGMTTGRPSAPD
jgi:GTP:adenosylcobinamide-phosphate guanylyltransferase